MFERVPSNQSAGELVPKTPRIRRSVVPATVVVVLVYLTFWKSNSVPPRAGTAARRRAARSRRDLLWHSQRHGGARPGAAEWRPHLPEDGSRPGLLAREHPDAAHRRSHPVRYPHDQGDG